MLFRLGPVAEACGAPRRSAVHVETATDGWLSVAVGGTSETCDMMKRCSDTTNWTLPPLDPNHLDSEIQNRSSTCGVKSNSKTASAQAAALGLAQAGPLRPHPPKALVQPA
eukprot:CAMPEP_0181169504 /NCGR_PEP_ID=MMETSP1096-20121128/853_1 /TAXON_ID=156174 ORGANISM="Chrysochromulina ericina, Strain CCMP281" /NCGR_SAMPLE_ID=MMETSP1096 /ASSEMBLY_ACC=CAM_ASM_000453 /LENGTH=110 /DNA_ID=CAMNT_0023256973 /DNA_START=389 /DNA_END=722 /DNA_ORIENTATION=-